MGRGLTWRGRQAQLLEERKKEVLSRVQRLECEAGHGIQGKYALEKAEAEAKRGSGEEAAAVKEGGGGTWAELSDDDDDDDDGQHLEGEEGEEDVERKELEHAGVSGGDEGEGGEGRGGAEELDGEALGGEEEGLDAFLYKERTCECEPSVRGRVFACVYVRPQRVACEGQLGQA